MPDWGKMIREQVTAVEKRVVDHLRALVQVAPIARSRADRAQRTEDWPGTESTGDRAAVRYQHFGFRSRPPKGVNAVRLLVAGGATGGVSVAEDASGYGPDDLDDSEVALYNAVAACVIKLIKTGAITITAAPNQDATVAASGTGKAKVTATPVTGAVELGPNPIAQVLVVGSLDGFGMPVAQLPAAALSIVKSG